MATFRGPDITNVEQCPLKLYNENCLLAAITTAGTKNGISRSETKVISKIQRWIPLRPNQQFHLCQKLSGKCVPRLNTSSSLRVPLEHWSNSPSETETLPMGMNEMVVPKHTQSTRGKQGKGRKTILFNRETAKSLIFTTGSVPSCRETAKLSFQQGNRQFRVKDYPDVTSAGTKGETDHHLKPGAEVWIGRGDVVSIKHTKRRIKMGWIGEPQNWLA